MWRLDRIGLMVFVECPFDDKFYSIRIFIITLRKAARHTLRQS
jgi:hypothetical protein